MLRSYREAEHSSGFSKSKSQSCPKSAWTVPRGSEFLMPGDIEAVLKDCLARVLAKAFRHCLGLDQMALHALIIPTLGGEERTPGSVPSYVWARLLSYNE